MVRRRWWPGGGSERGLCTTDIRRATHNGCMTSPSPPADDAAAPRSAPRLGTLPTENRLTPEEVEALCEDDRQAKSKIRQLLAAEQATEPVPAPGPVDAQPSPFAPRASGAPAPDRLIAEELEALRADTRAAKIEIRRLLAEQGRPQAAPAVSSVDPPPQSSGVQRALHAKFRDRLTPEQLAALREDAKLASIQIEKLLAESPPPTAEP